MSVKDNTGAGSRETVSVSDESVTAHTPVRDARERRAGGAAGGMCGGKMVSTDIKLLTSSSLPC